MAGLIDDILDANKNPYITPLTDKELSASQYIGNQLDINSPLPKEYSVNQKKSLSTPQLKEAAINDFANMIKGLEVTSQNTHKADGKQFGAGASGMNYERYADVNTGLYKKLGFVPGRDNESLYRENISVGQDLWRGLKGMWHLRGIAHSDSWSFGGLNTQDTKVASEFEDTMAKYSSMKDGITGFTTNTLVNLGYTAGMIQQFIEEETIIHAGTALLTAGSGSAVAAGRTVARGGSLLNKVINSFKGSSKLLATVDNFSDINKARNRWQQAGRSVMNFALPTETLRMAQNFKRLENLNGAQKTALGLASFFRDIRGIRYAFGESSLEGGSSNNELMRRQIASFENNNGRSPNEQELAEMESVAGKAGSLTFSLNMPIIYFSNKIALGALFKASSPFRNIVLNNKAFKLRDTGNKAKRFVVDAGSFSLKNAPKYFKTAPMAALRGIGNYTSANLTEGAQEVAQEIISGASNEYYDNIRKGITLGSFYNYLGDSAVEQVSPQGFETFASGFVMGGLVNVAAKPISYLTEKSGYVFNNKSYTDRQQSEQEALERKLEVINKYFEANPLDYFDPKRELLAKQNELSESMEDAIENEDEAAWVDLQDVSNFETFATAMQTGTYDAMVEEIKQLQNLTSQEIQDSYGVTGDEFNKYVGKVLKRANSIKENYNNARINMPNPYDVSLYDASTNPEEYKNELFNYLAHEEIVKGYVMAKYSFDRNKERKESLKDAVQRSIGSDVTYSSISPLFSVADMEAEIDMLKREIESMSQYTPTTKEAIKMLSDKQDRLSALESLSPLLDKALSVESEDDMSDVYEKFKDFLGAVAKENNSTILDTEAEATLKLLVDYHRQDLASPKIAKLVNMYINRNFLQKEQEQRAKEKKIEFDNKNEYIKAALDKFNKARITDEFLQSIYELGVFFDSDQFADFETTGRVPSLMFSVNDKSQILANSPLFKTVIDKATLFGVEVYGIPIQENDSPMDLGGVKRADDERTLDDIYKQYGNGVQDVRTVLNKVISSPFADERMIELAKRLLTITGPSVTISFSEKEGNNVVNPNPNSIIIDARYNSSNHMGNNSSIEHAILHAVMVNKVSIIEDSVFDTALSDVIKEINEYLESNDNEITQSFPRQILTSPKAFSLAVLTNESVQRMLSEIPSDIDSGRISVWDNFTKAITSWLKRLFGGAVSNTALNGAIAASATALESSVTSNKNITVRNSKGEEIVTDSLITHFTEGGDGRVHYIRDSEGNYEMVTVVSVAPTPKAPSVSGINSLTPTSALMANHPDLLKDLVDAYNDFTGDSLLISNAVGHSEFDNFKKTNPIASDIFKAFKPSASGLGEYDGRKKASIVKKLEQLGFSIDEIAAMSPQEAYDIASSNLDKDTLAIMETANKQASDENIAQEADSLIAEIAESEDVESLRDRVDRFVNSEEVLALNPMLAISVEKAFVNKVAQDSSKVEFSDLMVGDLLFTKKGERVVVSEIKGDLIIAENLENPTNIVTFTSDNINDMILGRAGAEETVEVASEEVSENSSNLSNDSISLITDKDFVDEALSEQDDKSIEDSWSSFLNDINKC